MKYNDIMSSMVLCLLTTELVVCQNRKDSGKECSSACLIPNDLRLLVQQVSSSRRPYGTNELVTTTSCWRKYLVGIRKSTRTSRYANDSNLFKLITLSATTITIG